MAAPTVVLPSPSSFVDGQKNLVKALLNLLSKYEPTFANGRLDDKQADALATAIEELLSSLNYRVRASRNPVGELTAFPVRSMPRYR